MINITISGNNTSNLPSLSEDGRYIAFDSTATNLIAGDTNSVRDIFVYDGQTSGMTNITISGNATSTRPFISADGRYVAFQSTATTFVSGDTSTQDIFVYDTQTN